jgi:hypothetical protein
VRDFLHHSILPSLAFPRPFSLSSSHSPAVVGSVPNRVNYRPRRLISLGRITHRPSTVLVLPRYMKVGATLAQSAVYATVMLRLAGAQAVESGMAVSGGCALMRRLLARCFTAKCKTHNASQEQPGGAGGSDERHTRRKESAGDQAHCGDGGGFLRLPLNLRRENGDEHTMDSLLPFATGRVRTHSHTGNTHTRARALTHARTHARTCWGARSGGVHEGGRHCAHLHARARKSGEQLLLVRSRPCQLRTRQDISMQIDMQMQM